MAHIITRMALRRHIMSADGFSHINVFKPPRSHVGYIWCPVKQHGLCVALCYFYITLTMEVNHVQGNCY